jgi:hypothetical protein
MGEFAEFCKGEQMGAFLPLLLAPGTARLDQDQASVRLLRRPGLLTGFSSLSPSQAPEGDSLQKSATRELTQGAQRTILETSCFKGFAQALVN